MELEKYKEIRFIHEEIHIFDDENSNLNYHIKCLSIKLKLANSKSNQTIKKWSEPHAQRKPLPQQEYSDNQNLLSIRYQFL
jgi:hypothetical protein